MNIIEFILARIAEDEAAARAVPPLDYNIDMGGDRQDERFTFGRSLPSSADGMGNWSKHRHSPTTRKHFTRWEPPRVLAECSAKRLLIRVSAEGAAAEDGERGCCHLEQEILDGKCRSNKPHELTGLRVLASIYADHPDYNQAWAL